MTTRDSVVFFTLQESEESIRQKIASRPFNRFPVCDGGIDKVVGYVDAGTCSTASWLASPCP